MTTKIQKYDFKEGLPHEFEIIDFKFLFNEFSTEIGQSHRAEFYQVIWFQEGETTHLVDFNPIQTKPNTLIFVGKGSVQRFDNKANVKGKVILFTDDFFCKSESETKFLRSTILFNDLLSISKIDISKSESIFTTILHQLEHELEHSNDNYQSNILHNNLQNLLLHAERERRQQDFIKINQDANFEYSLVFKEVLDNHFILHKKVNFYCNEMHLTPKRLNQATSKIFGKTPKELIDDRVLLESKRLLVHTTDNIKEIAFSLGFDEPTNFIKYFKKHIDKTPVEFRTEFVSA